MRRLLPFVLLAACSNGAIEWSDPASAPGDTLGALRLVDGSVAFTALPAAVTPPDSALCPASIATASDRGLQFATWLRKRPDSSVAVMAARWDGKAWTKPAVVDSVDIGVVGCNRPAPSIAVSAADGYVHIAYSLKAPEGYGVFFAHSMDRGLTFHWPVIVVYGDRLVPTDVAASGMKVIVAYEEPSGRAARVDVALSLTQGHTFEPRESGSPDAVHAARPRVALGDSAVALTFSGADSTQRAIRIGRIR